MPNFHPKHTPLLMALFMSCFMAFLMSGIVTLINQGLFEGFFAQWMHAYIRVWPIAFGLLYILRPLVTKIVSALVVKP